MNPGYLKVLGSVALITSLAVAAPTRAQEANAIAVATLKSQGLAEGPGLAAQFPGDEAIERDPRVLFVEDFESGAIRELGDRWGNATQPENLSFSPDIPPNSPGNCAARPGPSASPWGFKVATAIALASCARVGAATARLVMSTTEPRTLV